MMRQRRKWIVVIAAVAFACCGCLWSVLGQKPGPPDLSARYVQLTHPPESEFDIGPLWAPTGQTLYFARWLGLTAKRHSMSTDIWRYDFGKGTQEKIVRGDDAALSPDGRRLAYVPLTKSGYYRHTTILDLRTGSKTALGVYGYGISWAPNGRRLLYWQPEGDLGALKLMDLRTRKETTVDAYGVPDPRTDRAAGTWSPKGKLIAYPAQDSDRLRLHLRHVRSGKDEVVGGIVPAPLARGPAWSPDGSALAIAAKSAKNSIRIFRVTVATGKAQPITPGPDDWSPVWSPDGTRVAYTKTTGGSGRPSDTHVAVLDLRTHRETVFGQHSLTRPEWSPDSTHLACDGVSRRGFGGIWIINTEAGEARQK